MLENLRKKNTMIFITFLFCEAVMDILRNYSLKVVIFDRNSQYSDALDLISMCNITPSIFYYESEINSSLNQLLKKRRKHQKLPTKKNQSNFSQAQSLIKNLVKIENKNPIIQTDAEFSATRWFEKYTFFVTRGVKRPNNFLVNELYSLDEDITKERKKAAEIMQSLIKLEYCSTWLSCTKIFKEAGIKLGVLRNLEIYNG